jgi:hypothetical protein
MSEFTVYRFRSDLVFDGDVELNAENPAKAPIPQYHTRQSPHPIPTGHYAVMISGWSYVLGDPPPAPTTPPEQIQAEIVTATQQRLDDFAETRNYDGILSACTYAPDPNPKFASEGQYCIDARGATWTKLYEILAEVEAGTRPMPSGYADIEPELPVLAWPTQPE